MRASRPLKFVRAAAGAAALVVAGPLLAQGGTYAYPTEGQSEQQQSQDRFECHRWAVNQSGFDPTTAQPLPAQQPYHDAPPQQQAQRDRGFLGIGDGGFFEGGGMVGDAATGAALGAAGGAIAGDAGEGAAIGAIASTVFGAVSRSSRNSAAQRSSQGQSEEEYRRAQEQARLDQLYIERREKTDAYRRAYGACMSARGYSVQ